MARLILFLLQLMAGLSAVIAGTFLASGSRSGGPLGFPEEWLEGSPLSDYFVPGIVLACLGLTMLGGSYAQLARLAMAPYLSLLCGTLLVLWILIQMTIVPFTLMQPGTLAAGLIFIALSFQQLRDEIRPPKGHGTR
jgi:hypothetical protein